MQTDAEFYAELRQDFLASAAEDVILLESVCLNPEAHGGPEAAYRTLARRAHSLKGSGGSVGFPAVTTLCHRFEEYLAGMPAREVNRAETDRLLEFVDALQRLLKVCLEQDAGRREQLSEAILATLPVRATNAVKVLLADTSRTVRRICTQILSGAGYRITLADDGYTALGYLLRDNFQLLICSWQLPIMDGAALISAFKLARPAATTKTILMTTSEAHSSAAGPRPDHVVTKGATTETELTALVRRITGT